MTDRQFVSFEKKHSVGLSERYAKNGGALVKVHSEI